MDTISENYIHSNTSAILYPTLSIFPTDLDITSANIWVVTIGIGVDSKISKYFFFFFCLNFNLFSEVCNNKKYVYAHRLHILFPILMLHLLV